MTLADDTTNYDETCPLLRASNAEAQNPEKPKPTPLPKGQLAALCTVRLVDPIMFTQLFPYVNEFMNDLHLTDDPSKIGFYSGLVVRHLLRAAITITVLISTRRAFLLYLSCVPSIIGLSYQVSTSAGRFGSHILTFIQMLSDDVP